MNVIAYEGSPLAGAYSATKSALRSLTLSIAREVEAGSGVSALSFVPGIVDTLLIRDVLLPQFIALTETSEEEALAIIAQNPGYSGLVPVDECATALVYTVVHAEEYHGQVADPFEPLDRFGIIEIPKVDPHTDPDRIDVSGPMSGLYVKQYLGGVSSLNRELEQRIEVRTRELEEERARSESLLLSILPSPIAERLKAGENMIADQFEAVTVLFGDIVGFTPLSAGLAPQRVVEVLDNVFSAFDDIVAYFELEKIKTIGDCYMAVGGLPQQRSDHAELVASAALQMLPALTDIGSRLDLGLAVRIGLHSGPVVAGVIGQRKFIYDLWGDTVNTASRMETYGAENRIHCSADVHQLLDDQYVFEPCGDIEIKGKGAMQTFFLVGSR